MDERTGERGVVIGGVVRSEHGAWGMGAPGDAMRHGRENGCGRGHGHGYEHGTGTNADTNVDIVMDCRGIWVMVMVMRESMMMEKSKSCKAHERAIKRGLQGTRVRRAIWKIRSSNSVVVVQ